MQLQTIDLDIRTSSSLWLPNPMDCSLPSNMGDAQMPFTGPHITHKQTELSHVSKDKGMVVTCMQVDMARSMSSTASCA